MSQKHGSTVPLVEWVFNFLSCEWMLRLFGNGGLRAFLVATELFILAILIKSWCETGLGSEFSFDAARRVVGDHIEWLGALFAGCYAAFYTRFSSQWCYLADLYNQIMSMKCTMDQNDPYKYLSLAKWQVGFIADAHELHLDRKELFSSVICSMLSDSTIFDLFKKTVGTDKANEIIGRVGFTNSGCCRHTCKYRT